MSVSILARPIASEDSLRLYLAQDGITTLGPDSRYVLWVQGCVKRCLGCIAPDSRPLDGGYTASIDDLAQAIIASPSTGITLSGGEPMLQARALARLLSIVRAHKDIGVVLYTGYTQQELLQYQDCRALLSMVDVLIDGPFDINRNDGLPHRGSSNQRILHLTPRYARHPYYLTTTKRVMQHRLLPDGRLLKAGIPYAPFDGTDTH